ncbi:putative nuclease HARBI1 isoform X1 [Eupeodes corollae]|uniref:putative nuclease HARBI1 isoform X1 n=2 Tax=Eupeodes corollae TaxID=290404 RepID=UPI002493CEFF|nr:putative nuclease HARBI1 isoform X1 [Eupeodes corollae]
MSDSEEDEVIARAVIVVNDLLAVGSLSDQLQENIKEDRVRNTNYYEVVIPDYSLEEFRCHFRMSRSCFSDLMTKIGNLKCVHQLEKKLLYTIWTLSKQESFLSSGDRFNLAPSSAHNSFCEILDLLCSLLAQYIKWPSISQYNDISRVFREKSGGYIPGIVGAIDGCHIQIKQPVKNPIDYYNRKNTHSIILQGVCDHRAVFIDIYVGAPGRLHDARVFRNSPLSDKLAQFLPADYHLVGDAAYPLGQNLITPFRDNGHLLERQINFNTRLSSARITIERTFGFLKGRFRRLKYLDVSSPMLANKIITASCILLNHIHLFNESGNFSDIESENDDDLGNDLNSSQNMENQERSSCARKRNFLLNNF